MIIIPHNFIDRAASREKQQYRDPVFSREALIDLISLNGKKVLIEDFFDLYPEDLEKQKAMEYRLRAMVRDGQIISWNQSYTTLDYWPLVEGSIVVHDKEVVAILSDPEGFFPIAKLVPGLVFPGDYARFAYIEPLKQVALYSIIEASQVYLHGIVEDPKEYDLPSGYPIIMRVVSGVYDEQVVSVRNPFKKEISIGSKIYARMDRSVESDYILAEVVDFIGAPKGIHDIIAQYNLPWIWPFDVEKEARTLNESDISFTENRMDLTECPFVTIDGITAKDFDDAVYVEHHENGGFDLYVAIADVSHYVRPGTSIDREAAVRGVSVYFPRYVIPMLPEILSNELCSLKPDVLRYALVCQIAYNKEGHRSAYKFYGALIRSHARLTYDQVQRRDVPIAFKKNISELWDAYDLLKKARREKGYISFSQQAVHFDIADNEKVLGLSRVPPLESHHLIEEMMLAANECAALYIQENAPVGVYRVHDAPVETKVQMLNITLKAIGRELDPPYTLEKISELSVYLQQHYPKLATMISRIMQRAGYQILPDRHFGLNFDLYTHFTSPIRRYPDLIVHRLIYAILSTKKTVEFKGGVKSALDRVNYLERRAEEAERSYQQMLKVRFAQSLEGKEFLACVTGLSEFGVFIELDDYPIEGMVHFSQLGEGFWTYKLTEGSVSCPSRSLRVGDSMRVKLTQIDVPLQRINFCAVWEK